MQYLTNISIYMSGLLLPLWAAGLYRIFRRLDGVDYSFLGVLFLVTLVLLFVLHASGRMIGEVFMPLLAAGAVCVEEALARLRWETAGKVAATAYVAVVAIVVIPLVVPILPVDLFPAYAATFKFLTPPLYEFNGIASTTSPVIIGRLGWDEVVRNVAAVYNELPPEERAVAGIYSDSYGPAGVIDELGPQYGLPHAVSGDLTYYLWGPGYSWDVMIIVTGRGRSNYLSVLFDDCERKGTAYYEMVGASGTINVCRKPKVSADAIWSSMKSYR